MLVNLLFVTVFGGFGAVLLCGARKAQRLSGDWWAGWVVGLLLVTMALNEAAHVLAQVR